MRYFGYFFLLLIGCNSTTAPSSKEQINIRLGESIQMINPLLSGNAYSKQVEELIYLPLFQFDPVSLNLEPVLADRPAIVEEVEGQIKYKFHLRENARWSDGHPITSEDYAFTFKMIFNPALRTHGYRAYLSFLDSIAVDFEDGKNIEVWTNRKYHLAETVLGNIEIFPAHIYDENDVLGNYSIHQLRTASESNPELVALAKKFESYGRVGAEHIIGSGPYELVSWEDRETILLEKKVNYWAEEITNKPAQLSSAAEQINFKIIIDPLTAFQELRGGGIDVMNQTPLRQFNELQTANDLQFFSPSSFTYYYMAMNPERDVLKTATLRKAVHQSHDNPQWIAQQMFDLATVVTNPISPMKSYYDKTLTPIGFNPSTARMEFEKSGYSTLDSEGYLTKKTKQGTERLALKMGYSSANKTAASLALFFKEKAKNAGLEIIPDPLDFKVLRKQYRSGDYDLLFLASNTPPADYDPQQSWHTKSWKGGNRVKFGNERTDEIIDNICGSLDEKERANYYHDFQQSIYEETPFLFLYSPQQRVVARKGIKVQPSKLWPGFITQQLN